MKKPSYLAIQFQIPLVQLIKCSSLIILPLALTACSSNPNKAKELDNKIDVKANIGDEAIGLNENKEVIIQKEQNADNGLRELNWKQYSLEQQIASLHEKLTQCREEIADSRLGGSGNVTEIPEIDSMKTPTRVKEEMGINDKGQLKLLKKEMYLDRIKREKDYIESLSTEVKLIEKNKNNCEREMKIARVKHGLQAERYSGKGSYKDGKYIQTRRAEHNLDDAFSISSEQGNVNTEPTSDSENKNKD